MNRTRGWFITGTDTGVGKTLVTATLLRVLAGMGVGAVGMKPVAAGAEQVDGQWVNEDVELIRAHSTVQAPAAWVNPYLFREAIAPHIAAAHQGVRIELPRIVDACALLRGTAEVVLVEGVGGFRVPLDDRRDGADLAAALGMSVLLVVGMRLGCLNHALLTTEAIAARGLALAGWVANRLDPGMAAYEENLATLCRRIPAPLLADIPHLGGRATPESAARFLSPKRLRETLGFTA